ncbi:MAG: circularly permuted type 2 ATP-grasp protein [Rubrimonas sp.]|uniref:circularly permuted type 2 ATP-grasp protein n=1 Tax=Rubrimonas sp. TaxID=2036015 RepID=UPI002FDECBF0
MDDLAAPQQRHAPTPGRHDEMLGADGAPRPHWRAFAAAWTRAAPHERAQAAAESRRLLDESGLSYNAHADGASARGAERFDPTPLIISAQDWRTLEAGVIQRARMIEAALRDLYGARTLIATGALPPSVAFGSREFLREAARWERPPRRRLIRYAVDVARAPDGRWVLLDDHADRPDGSGRALANRIALAQATPELFAETGVRRLGAHFALLQETLEEETGAEGRIALLTPGPGDPSYFSHAYLARYLGITLVEPGDLAARDGEAHVKTLEGLRRVDVLLRGVGSRRIDPLYAPGGGALGAPGILRAARFGKLTFANALGAGVADGRALAPFSARLIGDLLGEEPALAEAPHLWLGDPAARAQVLEETARWSLGEDLDRADRDALARRLGREGWAHVARAPVALSVAPTLQGGELASAPIALRLFATAAPEGFRVMPGGVAAISPTPEATRLSLDWVVKDVWVESETERSSQPAATTLLTRRQRTAHLRRTGRELLSRVADNLFWLGRNAERAEATLRVLKAVLERMIDAPRADRDPALLHRLLSLRLEAPPETSSLAEVRARIALLALDRDEPNGLGQALDVLYWNASAARAHLSRDAWRDVSRLCGDPVWRSAPAPGRALALAAPIEDAIRSLAAFAGASHENMTRNYAWRFLELGRRIERAQQTVALFKAMVGHAGADEPAAIFAMLHLCDSFFAYRARYLTTPEAVPAIDLLILDEANPRSLAFQLARMEEVLDALPRATPYRNAEHRIALKLLTALRVSDADALGAVEFADPDHPRPALIALLADAEIGLADISDLVAKAYFAHAEPALTEIMTSRIARS